jgi:hypothetical protein
MCAFLISLYFFLVVYNLSYSVTCGEPTITITFQNQEENMEHVFVLYTLNRPLYTS